MSEADEFAPGGLYESNPLAAEDMVPDFAHCQGCGADAVAHVYWDPGQGWTCTRCGGCDGDD